MKVIIERGGNNLSYFAFTEFGQIYNQEISLLDRLGFRTVDEYFRVSTRLMLHDWKVPEVIVTEKIHTETFSTNDIYQILREDDNVPNAVIFQFQFQSIEPNTVILSLRNAEQEIMALAYYKVIKVSSSSNRLSAVAFNLHFRPQFELSRDEKKQFLQGVLYSMKQLEIHAVNSLMSLKSVDSFTLMVQEGFDVTNNNFFALSKKVENEKV